MEIRNPFLDAEFLTRPLLQQVTELVRRRHFRGISRGIDTSANMYFAPIKTAAMAARGEDSSRLYEIDRETLRLLMTLYASIESFKTSAPVLTLDERDESELLLRHCGPAASPRTASEKMLGVITLVDCEKSCDARLAPWGQVEDAKKHALAVRLLEEKLPYLATQSFEDILDLRTKLEEELLHFKDEVRKLSAQVATTIWDDRFQKDLETLVSENVRPTVNDLRRKLRLSRDKTIKTALANARSLKTGVTLGSTLFAGMPLYAALAFSLGIGLLDTFLDRYFEGRS
ncbi:MAG: hypothetical protein H8E44_47900, partial [Planctomycetes bacterium]|nr:hypothetical protein [Planctomycetota bacterium]